MSRKVNEIGSEFWIESVPDNLLTERDGVYCLSGRTAIDLILQDILRKRTVRSVAMPGWCCDSMVSPFVAYGIEVRFYDICHTEITEQFCEDVFYLTNYFGYENTLPLDVIKKVKEKGAVIIYDRTHSFLLDDTCYCELADYNFASIRKWMGVVGGALVEGLKDSPHLRDCPYLQGKEIAMRDKYHYLQGDNSIVKDKFLAVFREFGHRLVEDYCNYAMDDLSYTLYKHTYQQMMKQQRRENAAYIHEHLKGVRFLYELTDAAAPLFVPVLFENKEQRDYVRKKMIEQQIYCPVHWPQPTGIPAEFVVNDIVGRELSLICDQRYGLNDIKQEIETIKLFI